MELLEALKDYGIDKIATILNEVCDTGQVSSGISKFIFIELPKKLEATEYELYRIISLMSYITKVHLSIDAS